MIRPPFLALTALSLASIAPVHAQSVEFHLTGQIAAPTCELAVSDVDRTVLLDPIDARSLPGSGATGFKPFVLTANNCAAGLAGVTFAFAGSPDADDPLRFASIGDARGVAIELQSSDGVTIGANGTNSTRTVGIVADRAELPLRAAYWRVAGTPLRPGTVTAVATVMLRYE